VSAQGDPEPDDARSVQLRWLGRGAVAAIGLWFLFDGLRGVWSGAVAALVVLGVALAGVGILFVIRRGRPD